MSFVACTPVGSGQPDRSAASTPTLSAPCAYTPTSSMSGRPMMACSDRRPMFPVVHWMTRKGRSALAVLIVAPLPMRGWTHYAKAIFHAAQRASTCWAGCGQAHVRPVGVCWRRAEFLGVQPGELVLAVLPDAGGAPDLAARRGGNRPGRYQHEVPYIHAVCIGYRGGDVAFDPAEQVHRLLGGIPPLLELDDRDQLLGAIQR